MCIPSDRTLPIISKISSSREVHKLAEVVGQQAWESTGWCLCAGQGACVFHKGIPSFPGAAPCSDFQSRGCQDTHSLPHAKGGWEQLALLLLPKASITVCYESSGEAKHS